MKKLDRIVEILWPVMVIVYCAYYQVLHGGTMAFVYVYCTYQVIRAIAETIKWKKEEKSIQPMDRL